MTEATYTPDWLAADMAALANIGMADRILEPSAGRGALLQHLKCTSNFVTAVELNQQNLDRLQADWRMRANCVHADFLTWEPEPLTISGFTIETTFDRVVMNPPKDAEPHVLKAARLLGSGGRLVALLHEKVACKIQPQLFGSRRYGIMSAFEYDGVSTPANIFVWDKP